jgi:hypothetical protein
MKTIQETANDIALEVERAEQQWGTSFDLNNTLNDWAAFSNIYMGDAAKMGASKESIVKNVRKAAGILLSALRYAEADMLCPRHYDGQQRPESLPEIEVDNA